MTEREEMFSMPGIKSTIDSLNRHLEVSSSYLDHILICGPRGSGKNYFSKIVKKILWNYSEIIEVNCEIFNEDQYHEWLQYEYNEERVIFLDNFDRLDSRKHGYLSGLMERVRVVVVMRNDDVQLPQEFLEKFKITIDVPPLCNHRADILYFIARKWPNRKISSVALMRLFAYHWPGNYRELDRTVQQWFSNNKLPDEITGEDKFRNIFFSLLENGLDFPKLKLTIDTCFKHIVPLIDDVYTYRNMELRHIKNDCSGGVELFVDPDVFPDPFKYKTFFNDLEIRSIIQNSSKLIFGEPAMLRNAGLLGIASFWKAEIVLDEKEILLIIKSFFQLVYGKSAMLQNQNLFDLDAFGEKSIDVIDWAEQEVGKWVLGCSCSGVKDLKQSLVFDFSNSLFTLPFFTKRLSREQINAASNFLSAARKVQEKNVIPQTTLVRQDNFTSPHEIQSNDYYEIGKAKLCSFFDVKSFNTVKNRIDKYNKDTRLEEKSEIEIKYTDDPQPRPKLKMSEILKLRAFKKK